MKLLTVLLAAVVFAAPATAQQMSLEADRVERPAPNIFIAEGNVFVFSDNTTISADRVRLNRGDGIADAEGNVTISSNGNVIRADTAHIDMTGRHITADNVTGYAEPYYHYTAARINQVDNLTFTLDDARFSTCAGENPDWSFTASHAKITVGGYFQATNTAARIKNVPVLYAPWLIYPVKTERQSGLLIPRIANSSRTGLIAEMRYFQNLGVDMDTTAGITHFDTKGQMAGLEYRWAPDTNERLYLAGDFLDDRSSDADINERWRGYADTYLDFGGRASFTLSADYVSDWLYMRDFSEHSMARDETSGIDADEQTAYFAEASFAGYTPVADISIRRRVDTEFIDTETGYKRTSIERLANLRIEKRFPRSPFIRADYRFDHDSLRRTIHVFNTESANTTSRISHQRDNMKLTLYRPVDIRIATVTPTATGYWTRWTGLDDPSVVTESDLGTMRSITVEDDTVTRQMHAVGYTVALKEIYRDFGAFRHSVYNRLTYKRTPRLDQSGIPDLVEYDLLTYSDTYTYSLINFLRGSAWNAKLTLSQAYDQSRNTDKLDPFSVRIEADINKNVLMDAEHRNDHYGTGTTYLASDLTLRFAGFRLSDRYLFDRATPDETNTSHTVKVAMETGRFEVSAAATYGGTFEDPHYSGLDVRKRNVSVVYLAECWDLGLAYDVNLYDIVTADGTHRGNEYTLSLVVALRGLGRSTRQVASY